LAKPESLARGKRAPRTNQKRDLPALEERSRPGPAGDAPTWHERL